jgi:hypothetical protein
VEEASEDSPSKTPIKAVNKKEEKTPVPKKGKRKPKDVSSDSELSELSEDEGGFLKTPTTKPKDKGASLFLGISISQLGTNNP